MFFGRPSSLSNLSAELIHKAEEQAKKGHITKITKKGFFLLLHLRLQSFEKEEKKTVSIYCIFFVLQIYAFPYLFFHLEKIEILFVNCNYKNVLIYLESISVKKCFVLLNAFNYF
jgi:hypothetical protein